MKDKNTPYYIGLDCGTSSVGWAVSDENYNLLKGTKRIKKDGKLKTKKQTLWGFRLFEEANTAAERRGYRSSRRRLEREKTRRKLLQMLFTDEISKVDPEFYQRLRESFYIEEDKRLSNNSKNTLFNDVNYKDKDFHKKYPTIWHLRQAIMDSVNDTDKHFDIREYFLAIQHILKHRGHFLRSDNLSDNDAGFAIIFDNFRNEAEKYSYVIIDDDKLIEEKLNKKESRRDKKKELADILYIEDGELEVDMIKGQKELAALIAGCAADLKKIFFIDDGEKYSYSFTKGVFEEKIPEIEDAIGVDNMDLIYAAHEIYNYVLLKSILGDFSRISDSMVANYKLHHDDLEKLKKVFHPHKEVYARIFKNELGDGSSYADYIYSNKIVSHEDFNKVINKALTEIRPKTAPELLPLVDELLERSDTSENSTSPLLLPKQKGFSKGTIPQQLHHNELKAIVEKLQKDFPSFAMESSNEPSEYNTKAKKILSIHEFRIPYYCGPLVTKDRSEFSWAETEIKQKVYPWNFNDVVDIDVRADKFIRRMTNECTYIRGEDVLPKSSMLYQRYMVLNELNNLKVNNRRIDNELKKKIFERVYHGGELSGSITLKKLSGWLKNNSLIATSDELSGTNEVKILPKYSTYRDFIRILGEDFEHKYSVEKLEEVIEAITILGEEKKMLKRKIQKILNCDEKIAGELSKLSYKDWGKLSAKFLNGITIENRTVLDWLYETNKNLMELRGQEVGFGKLADDYNEQNRPVKVGVSYEDVAELYCSPAVKRGVWQTLKIVKEVSRNLGHDPAKIFIEVTRGEDKKAKGKNTVTRKDDLLKGLKRLKSDDDITEILKELKSKAPEDLQSKKLFLYYSQNGKCAYSGDPISMEDINDTHLYDIDHIYPRSLTKDDSITRNLVLVKAELNREKTNIYPIDADIRVKMQRTWTSWLHAGLITKEKYERLVRSTSLTSEELGQFIARQLVETSQVVKAVRNLLLKAYPKTKVVLVKAGQVSELRHVYGYDKKDKSGNVYQKGRQEFIKVRGLNDLHHAKDAYLNIVVGNVMNSTFSDNPAEWVKKREGKEYTIKPERIFREHEEYEVFDPKTETRKKTKWPYVASWDFERSLEIVSKTLSRNDVVWTRMNYARSGMISKATILGKGSGELQIKNSPRLSTEKYGGYTKVQGMYFALIEQNNRRGDTERRIISVPIIHGKNLDRYIRSKYPEARIIIPIIKYQSLLKLNDFPMHISGKTNDKISFYPAVECYVDAKILPDLKAITSVAAKITKEKNYKLSDCDNEALKNNIAVYKHLTDKMDNLKNMPLVGPRVPDVKNSLDAFSALSPTEQCIAIDKLLKVLSCGATTVDFSNLISSASQFGKGVCSSNMSSYDSALLVNQSTTGLREEVIDLKTCPAQKINYRKMNFAKAK